MSLPDSNLPTSKASNTINKTRLRVLALVPALVILGIAFFVVSSGMIQIWLGEEYKKEKKYLEAAKSFNAATKLNPKSGYCYYEQAKFLREYADELTNDDKQQVKCLAEAASAAKKARELDPHNDRYYELCGEIFAAQGDIKAAIENATLRSRFDDLRVNALSTRAALYDELGDEKLAIADYKSTAKLLEEKFALKPADYDSSAYQFLATTHRRAGQFDQANASYQKGFELHRDPFLCFKKAMLLEQQGKDSLAIEDYSKVVAILDRKNGSEFHNHPAAIYRRCMLYLKQKQYALALKDADRLVARQEEVGRDPKRPSDSEPPSRSVKFKILNAMGAHDQAQKELALATEDLNEVISHSPKSVMLYPLRAQIYLSFNLPKLALQDFESARRLSKSDEYDRGLGDANFALGHYDQAAELYKKCLVKEPHSTELELALAKTWIGAKKPALTIESCNKIIKATSPYANAEAHRLLSSAYQMVGDKQRAAAEHRLADMYSPPLDLEDR